MQKLSPFIILASKRREPFVAKIRFCPKVATVLVAQFAKELHNTAFSLSFEIYISCESHRIALSQSWSHELSILKRQCHLLNFVKSPLAC